MRWVVLTPAPLPFATALSPRPTGRSCSARASAPVARGGVGGEDALATPTIEAKSVSHVLEASTSTTPELKLGACSYGGECRAAIRERHILRIPSPVRIGRLADNQSGAVQPVSAPRDDTHCLPGLAASASRCYQRWGATLAVIPRESAIVTQKGDGASSPYLKEGVSAPKI
jgi:hypothetical protein